MKPFDHFYDKVPNEQRERLRLFRENHPLHKTLVNSIAWEYLKGGTGDETVLLLVGGLRVADAGFRAILELERDFRVIAPTYPPVETMQALSDGLAGVLAAEEVERVHVLAGSFGGMVAQCFARQHPMLVKTLILSNTAVLDAKAAERYQTELEMIAPVPRELVREGAKERFYQMIAPPESESTFWRAYLDELFSVRLDKTDLLSTYRCLVDFINHYTLTPVAQPPTLIIESEDDATFSKAQREAVKALYPHAALHSFKNAGHSAATTQRDTYFRVVRDFIHKC